MEFQNIKYFTKRKILPVVFEKKDVVSFIGKIVELKKQGKNYFIEIQGSQYKMILEYNTEVYIEELLDKKKVYLAKLEDINTIIVLEYNSGQNINLPILYEKKDVKGKNKKRTESELKNLTQEYTVSIRPGIDFMLFGVKDIDEYVVIGENTLLYLERKEKDYFKDGKKLITEVFVVKKQKRLVLKELDVFRIIAFKGKIEFLDDSQEFRESIETQIALDNIKDNPSSYLKIWEEYSKVEMEHYDEEAKTKGEFIILDTYDIKKEVIGLKLNKASNFKEGDSIDIEKNSEEIYDTEVEEDAKGVYLNVRYKENFPNSLKNCTLRGSIKGNKTMFDRRERAKNLILEDKAGMNSLSLIIEGKKTREKRKRNLKALSLQTKKELFPKYDPTDNQKKAIEIALNTPDIALIQGPPGTGKTTVITAILKRLSEERKEIGNIAGNNLITSFQHDAVINAASRIKNLGGIPAEKYGQRGDSEDILNRVFRDYIDNALNEYYREEPQLKRKKEEEELLEIYDYYSKNLRDIPLKEEIISLLKQLYLFVSRYYIPNVKDEIDKLQDELNRVNKKKYFIEKRFFYKLPICQEMLEDGGRKFIEKSIETLESEIANGEISKEEFQREIEILNILSKREKIDFKVMKRCKNSILSKLAEIDIPFLDRSSNEKIEKIFESINQILKDIQETSKEYKDDIKIKYLRELENNPLRVRDTLRSYMSTFGATCQQTQGKQIKEAKNGGEKVGRSSFELEKCERYENVLIDEAARSNPPDLLIPMSMATERIILVGDHKQLPHLIDETIVDKMGKNSKSVKEEYEEQIKGKVVDNQLVKISMFEFLVEKCRELENIDGVKRLIMLDTQYRMHPKIGTFISENFYEGKLKNGLSADKFQTTLKGLEGKAFAWYDVPYTDEYREVTRSKSKVRTKEAEEIAKFIYKHIDSKEAEGKSFGIITFYREQVEEIYKELSKEKNLAYKDQKLIVEKQKNGEYKISDSYSNLGYEKLRIGSVDSFQGMEFNYVCLSMVRSNKNPLKDEKDVRSKFGFLTNPNRLCVAMSRQKELLVMFGDSQMLEEGEYSDIKPLQDFLRMCKEEREYGEYKSIL